MELIEQDFLEAMFEDLLREEDEKESYYGPTEGAEDKSKCEMQLPRVCFENVLKIIIYKPNFSEHLGDSFTISISLVCYISFFQDMLKVAFIMFCEASWCCIVIGVLRPCCTMGKDSCCWVLRAPWLSYCIFVPLLSHPFEHVSLLLWSVNGQNFLLTI